MMNSKNYLLAGILISFALGGIKARAVNPALPSIPANIFNVAKFGALGDGVKYNTTNIQNAINAASAAGGGIIEFSAGKYLSGPLTLKSHINLRLDDGARLLMLPL
ncbi:MAG TPA: glycosyl hydrolase family 28-related protein, partial [Verrucomicrobiae bacterium]|nr:glycosyl hydrolase family 28-related protein [Verrucomicrobiae bacterium]